MIHVRVISDCFEKLTVNTVFKKAWTNNIFQEKNKEMRHFYCAKN